MLLEMTATSKALGKRVSFNVLLPEKKDGVGVLAQGYKTLWLLHGLAGDHNSWLHNTSIVRYANEYGCAVVMPNADRSWYADTAYGANYFTFITKELPELCRSTFKGMSCVVTTACSILITGISFAFCFLGKRTFLYPVLSSSKSSTVIPC